MGWEYSPTRNGLLCGIGRGGAREWLRPRGECELRAGPDWALFGAGNVTSGGHTLAASPRVDAAADYRIAAGQAALAAASCVHGGMGKALLVAVALFSFFSPFLFYLIIARTLSVSWRPSARRRPVASPATERTN